MMPANWFCQTCRVQSPSTQEHCVQCKAHWKRVWKKPARRSKSAQRNGANKEKQNKAQPLVGDPTQMVEQLPWIISIPQARAQRKVEEAYPERGPSPPPPPVVAPPIARTVVPKTSLSGEDQQLMQTLRQLASQIELPAEMAAKLLALEAQQKQAAPAISHAQVNRLSKLRSQLATLSDKIKNADQEWEQFMKGVMSRVNTHVQAYKDHRQGLMDAFSAKQEELLTVKRAIQEASMTLTHPEAIDFVPTTAPDLQGPLQELQRLSQPALTVPTVNLEGDSEEDTPPADAAMSEHSEPEEATEGATASAPPKITRHTSYRTSPNRPKQVAKEVLKTKGDKPSKEDKGAKNDKEAVPAEF